MNERRTIGGEVLNESMTLTLREVCHFCGTREEVVIEMVREGVVQPKDPHEDAWTFSGIAVTRIRTAMRLQQDLEVNLPGAALALELLEEIERLKRQQRR